MNILAIETSTMNLSLAVAIEGKIAAKSNALQHKVMSSNIIPKTDALLKKARLKLHQIDGFAVGLGPGSFTSLRVGLSTVKAFAFATSKPVVGISSLEILAASVKEQEKSIAVVVDAKRELVYFAKYQKQDGQLMTIQSPLLLPLNEIGPYIMEDTLFTGDALALYADEIKKLVRVRKMKATFTDERTWKPRADVLAKLSLDRFSKGKTDHPITLSPLYLYREDCQVHRGK